MVKKIATIVCLMMMAAGMAGAQAFAETDTVRLSSENTTVQNQLPQVRIYCETTEDYQTEVSVDTDGYPAKVLNAQAFRDLNEGINYYMLVDVSGSIGKKDFRHIRSALIRFADNELNDRDRIMLIPFGERVYYDGSQEYYESGSEDFAEAVNAMRAKDNRTNLYDAIDTVAGIIESDHTGVIERNAVLVFTDGVDDTTGGYKNEKEAPQALQNLGTPLYAFAVGKEKEGKDKLGVLARSLNGRIYTEDVFDDLQLLKESLDNTLTIDAESRNASALGAAFDVTVSIAGQEQAIVRNGVAAQKSGEVRNSLGYVIKTFIRSYWWLLAVLAIALIAAIVIMIIRRHKGIVKVDGETVFRDNVTQKQRIKVDKKQIMKLIMTISVGGSNEIVREVDLVSSVIVGRSNACDLAFDDPAMARQNFCIECRDGRLFIRDLQSTNGTILNGVKLTGPQELHRGDVIIAGKTRIVINW